MKCKPEDMGEPDKTVLVSRKGEEEGKCVKVTNRDVRRPVHGGRTEWTNYCG